MPSTKKDWADTVSLKLWKWQMRKHRMEHPRQRNSRFVVNLEGKNCYVIALAINGKMLDSVALSEKVSDLMVKGNSHIVLVIGGSLGIADEVLKRADEKISFSKMTFPHQLMRVILLEQLYRSYRIINHEPYHK